MVLMVTSLRRIRKNLPTKIFEIMTHNSSLILFMSYQTVFNQSREMVALSSLKLLLLVTELQLSRFKKCHKV